jgi:hypothetical protein
MNRSCSGENSQDSGELQTLVGPSCFRIMSISFRVTEESTHVHAALLLLDGSSLKLRGDSSLPVLVIIKPVKQCTAYCFFHGRPRNPATLNMIHATPVVYSANSHPHTCNLSAAHMLDAQQSVFIRAINTRSLGNHLRPKLTTRETHFCIRKTSCGTSRKRINRNLPRYG